MRRVHQRLAGALVIARDSIESGDPAPPSLDPLTYCWAFCAALDGHHEGEDTTLFPRLIEQQPEWIWTAIEPLQAGSRTALTHAPPGSTLQ